MSFAHPAFLLLLVLVPALAFLAVRSRAAAQGPQRWLTFALHGIALAALVLALAGPHVPGTPTSATRVVVLAAGPDADPRSMQEARDLAAAWRAATPYADRFHAASAGEPLVLGPRGAARFPEAAGTPDLAAALRAALAMAQPERPLEVALLADGTHRGAALEPLLAELSARRARLHLRALPLARAATALHGVAHPGHALVGEVVQLVASVEGAPDSTVRVEVAAAGRRLGEVSARLHAGVNRIAVPLLPEGEGVHVLRTTIRGDGAADPERGSERSALLVQGRARILHVSEVEARTAALQRTVLPLGFDVVAAPLDRPWSRAELGAYAAVVVDDTPATAWPATTQEALRDAVLRDGMGLLMAGAWSNLGPGGYDTSPLAEILPARAEKREERRDPSVALVIVIDTSGSMSGTRIELAKEVARLAIKRLLPHDKVGLVEFYGSKRWAAPLQPAGNTIEVMRALNRMQAGGGTIIYSALEEAYYALLNARTRFKHALVLTDGGVESGPFEELARRMAESGINVNSVLIGPQGNSPFLQNLAQWGRGRFYAAPSRFQLPDLRFKEPQSAPLSSVEEGAFPLRRTGAVEATAAFAGDALPPAGVRLAAQARPGASVLLASEGRPYLLGWDQGMGRVLVLAGDLLGPGTQALRADPAYAAFVADLLRGLGRSRDASRPTLELSCHGGWLEARLRGADPAASVSFVLEQDGVRTAPRSATRLADAHVAVLPCAGEAPLVVEALGAGSEVRAATIAPLPAGRRAARAEEALRRLSAATGGSLAGPLPPEPPLWSEPVPQPVERTLLLIALVAFLLALLVRRLPWPQAPGGPAPLLVLLLLPALAQAQDDPIQARLRTEYAAHGHLDALRAEWRAGTVAQRMALHRAEGELAEALALLPVQPEHRADRALLLDALGQPEAALQEIEAVLAGPLEAAERASWLLRRGELLLALGRGEPAAEALRAAAAALPDPGFRYRLGHLAGGYGLHALALELHDAGQGTRYQTHVRRALWQERLGRVDAANQELELAYAAAVQAREKRFVLGRIVALHRDHGALARLADEWPERAATDPLRAAAYLEILRELGRAEAALGFLARHEHEDLWQEAFATAIESGDAPRALRLGEQRLAQRPEDGAIRVAMAVLLVDRRELARADELLRAGVPVARGVKHLLRLAAAADELSLDGAFQATLAALRASGKDADVFHALQLEVRQLTQRQRRAEAERLLLGAREAFTDPKARVQLAEALEGVGRRDEAIELFRTAWQATQAEDVGLRLAWLLSASRDTRSQDEAEPLFRKLWLSAGSPARRVQAEERVLDLASRNGTLADLAVELEEDLTRPDTEHRELKRAALVKIFTRARDTLGAAAVLRELAQREPARRVEALQALARVHLEAEEFPAQERVLRELMQLDPEGELEYRMQLAMGALERGRPALAQQILDEMLARGGALGEAAREFAAGVHALAGQHEAAVRVYRRGLATHPDRVETWLLLGNSLRAAGRGPAGIGVFCDILMQDVPDDLLLVAADGLLNLEAPAPVLAFAERVVRRRFAAKPEKVYLLRMVQDLAEARRDDAARLRALEDVLPIAAEQRTTFVRELMDEARNRRDWKSYVRHGQDLLAGEEEVPPAVFLDLGEAWLRLGEFRAAERAFARSGLATDFAAMERRVAGLYQETGRPADAERVWRRILRRDPHDTESILAVARLAERRGARGEAAPLYVDAALRLLPDEMAEQAQRPARTATPRATAGPASQPSARTGTAGAPTQPSVRIPLASAGVAAGFQSLQRAGQGREGLAEEALRGALRTAGKPEEVAALERLLLQPLRQTPPAAPAVRVRALEYAHRLRAAGLLAWPEAELAAGEDRLAAADADAARTILRWRLAAGDLGGARRIAGHVDPRGGSLPLLTLDLFTGDLTGVAARLAEVPSRQLLPEAQLAFVMGQTELARELATRYAAEVVANPQLASPSWMRLAGQLGLPADQTAAARARLDRALADKPGPARVLGVLSALRATDELPAPARAEALRAVLPDVQGDRAGNLAWTFLQVARGVLDAAELAPLAELALPESMQPLLLGSRLRVLELLPAARQRELVDKVLRRLPPQERTTQVLMLLGRDGEALPRDVRQVLVELLDLRQPAPTQQHWLTQIALGGAADPEVEQALHERLARVLPRDPRVQLMGARVATEAAVRDERALAAIESLRASKDAAIRPHELAPRLVDLLAPEQLEPLHARLGTDTSIDLMLRAQILLRRGDVAGAIDALRHAALARPDDTILLQRVTNLLALAGQPELGLDLWRKSLDAAPQVYPYQAGRVATQLLRQGKPVEALAVLDRARDEYGSQARLELAVVANLPEGAQRLDRARVILQKRGAARSRVSFGTTRADRFATPAEAFAPLPSVGEPPRTVADFEEFANELDLLGFFPEGLELAEQMLRTMASAERDRDTVLHRVRARRLLAEGRLDAEVASARRVLETEPWHGASLRALFAAAQVGAEVPPELLRRSILRRLALDPSDQAFQVEALLLTAERRDEVLVPRLLGLVAGERNVLMNSETRGSLPALLGVLARTAPETLLTLAPGQTPPNADAHGEVLLALAATPTDPEAIARAFSGMPEFLGGPASRYRRERLTLPWAGVLLRLGRVDDAIALLTQPGEGLEQGDPFPPQALAAALPPLSLWREPAQAGRVGEALLEAVRRPLDPGRRYLLFRLGAVLARRLAEAGEADKAHALRAALAPAMRGLPGALAWLAP